MSIVVSIFSCSFSDMGNGESSPTKSVLTSVASYVAFIGACVDRKTNEISDFVDKENRQSIYVNEAIRKRRSIHRSANSAILTPRTPPLSARSKQNIADREDHILLSARSIAIQKKAPLFRDTGEDELTYPVAPMSGRKLDMNAINDMIEKDRIRRTSVAPS